MKRIGFGVLLLVFLVAFVSCSTAKVEDVESFVGLEEDMKTKFLFIGNSYTYYNDMPTYYFANILESAGIDAEVDSLTQGSQYLIDTADPLDSLGKKVEAALSSKKYDYVILQEQSTCPVLENQKFNLGVTKLNSRIQENGAKVVLYETWGRKAGSATLVLNKLTTESMTYKLAAAYESLGKELGLDVAYVGLAFYDVGLNHPEIELFNSDRSHPSPAGSFLAALTIFAQITQIDPTTVSYDGALKLDVGNVLKEAAKKAVFETVEIPSEYRSEQEKIEDSVVYSVDTSKTVQITELLDMERLLSVDGPKGLASKEYSVTGLSEEQKADIADINYGVSVIGVEKMSESSKGYETAVENLVNKQWSNALMCCLEFDDKKYNIEGQEDEKGPYRALITLNFGQDCVFEAFGFSSGNLKGFPGAAEVFVSSDGVSWTRVDSACWDKDNGSVLVSAGKTPKDLNGNTGGVTCLFDMKGIRGRYIRLGIVTGRNDEATYYNTINTREILVYGVK